MSVHLSIGATQSTCPKIQILHGRRREFLAVRRLPLAERTNLSHAVFLTMPEPEDVPSHPAAAVRRRLEAVRGYCELGLPELARDELEPLRPSFGHLGEVMEMDLMILMMEKRWGEALELALRLQRLHPSQPAGWLQASFCLHELGRTREALERLVSGPRALREVPLFHYNTGCYLARLGKLRDAMASLRRAFEMDAEYLESARTDPDLAALRDQL